MRLSHTPSRTSAVFDDPNLVSHGGLVPVMALAERAGLPGLLAEHVRPGGECGVNAPLKVCCLVAGMAAGADSVDDMGLLRHGAMGTLFGGVRAPSTLGSHLRSYTWGNVLQLEKAGRELLARLSCGALPLSLERISQVALRHGPILRRLLFGVDLQGGAVRPRRRPQAP